MPTVFWAFLLLVLVFWNWTSQAMSGSDWETTNSALWYSSYLWITQLANLKTDLIYCCISIKWEERRFLAFFRPRNNLMLWMFYIYSTPNEHARALRQSRPGCRCFIFKRQKKKEIAPNNLVHWNPQIKVITLSF